MSDKTTPCPECGHVFWLRDMDYNWYCGSCGDKPGQAPAEAPGHVCTNACHIGLGHYMEPTKKPGQRLQ